MSPTPDTIVLFGASGDLARKMLFPALYRLEERGALSQRVVGVALDAWDDTQFAQHVAQSISQGVTGEDDEVVQRLLDRLSWVGGDYADSETYRRLASAGKGTSLHYLAIPPVMFENVIVGLHEAGLLEESRILVEKPFGHDLESARHLNGIISRYLAEEQINRIDHFLGKESVENLLTFRYANPIFDAVWSRHYVDYMQLTMAEAFGIEERGALYETLGVVRDVVQNHLLQVVCLLTMEAPVSPDAEALNDERAKVLKSIRTLRPEDVVYGQYEGYRGSPHVAETSSVPTFVALRLDIDNPRWHGIPLYIRAGKSMTTTATQAVMVFRESPPLPFSAKRERPEANRLVFRLGPDDGVDLLVQTKVPGDGVRLATTPLTVNYESLLGHLPLAYETVLHDALTGNRSVFTREDTVEEAWRIFDPILDPPGQPHIYPLGSWGPPEAADVLEPGVEWLDPTPG
jgi:glucose-6-phosphate 1-dehydrogenase